MVWLSIAVVGVTSVVRVTEKIHHRAIAQTSADSIALAAAGYDDETALRFARLLHVSVVSLHRDNNTVTVHVLHQGRRAVATALQPV